MEFKLAHGHVPLRMRKRKGQVAGANQRTSDQNLDEQNSVERERKRTREKEKNKGAHTSWQNASISRAITYLNAVPVISCCPLFDNNLSAAGYHAIRLAVTKIETRANEQASNYTLPLIKVVPNEKKRICPTENYFVCFFSMSIFINDDYFEKCRVQHYLHIFVAPAK